MAQVHITTNTTRRIAAGVWLLVAASLFLAFPGALHIALAGPLAYILPIFAVLAFGCLLFNLPEGPFAAAIIFKTLLLALCIFLLLYLTEITAKGKPGSFFGQGAGSFLFGIAILASLLAAAFALLGRISWALRLTACVVLIYSLVGYFTQQFRGTPFIPQDMFSAGTALAVLPGYTLTFTQPLAEATLIFLSVIILAAQLSAPPALQMLLRRPPFKPVWGVRGVALAASVAFVMLTVTNSFMNKHFRPDFWNQNNSAKSHGGLVNFVANIPGSFFLPPAGYSLDAVNAIAARYTSAAVDTTTVRPDVILIMGESWGDITPPSLVRTNKPVIPFLSGFTNRPDGIYRGLIASTYGGGTSRSEFEVFTGANVRYGLHQVPFQLSVKKPIPNMVESFKALGYETTALHTGEAGAWGRDKAFPLMGFDRFLAKKDLQRPGSRMIRNTLADELLYTKALNILETAEEPQFIYLITLQTHGGFTQPGYTSPISIEKPAGNFPKTEQFLGLLHESDKDMAAFITALEKRERPTVVIAYGDHLPLVDDDYIWKTVKRANPFKDNGRMQDFLTFFVVWANYPLPEEVKAIPQNLSISYLNPYTMLAAGQPLTGYQKFLLDGAKRFPVTSAVGFIDAKGRFIPEQDALNTSISREQAIMHYNLVEDRKNIPQNFFRLKKD
ncbi:MAG: hypothetical protein DELT_02750 [Desulfovibrio sp.]